MDSVVVLLLLLICVVKSGVCEQLNQGYPPCTEIAWVKNSTGGNSRVDIQKMLYSCADNMPGPLMIPSYFPYENGIYHPVNVSIQIALNNLIAIDDVTSEVRLDFWYRNFWQDPRWFMPSLWENINPEATTEGINIIEYVRSSAIALSVWLPDIEYFQGTDIEYYGEMLSLYPNGTMFWSRHAVVTLSQAQMSLKKFPMDSQNFSITFQSYAYDGNLLLLSFPANGAIQFNYDSEQGKTYVQLNQLWTYKSYSAYSIVDPSPMVLNPKRTYSTAYVNILFQRQSFGIIFRLALPVTIFLAIVGFSFWADIDKRIDVTLQMLLIVAALYLIIGQVIPFVGYLTTMDEFITSVFIILSLTIGVHFITLLLDRKQDKYPMNSFYRDSIVWFFKLVWVPFAISVLVIFFSVTDWLVLSFLYGSVAMSFMNCAFKFNYIQSSFKKSVLALRIKKDQCEIEAIERSQLTPSQKSLNENVVILKMSKFELWVLKISCTWYHKDVLDMLNDIEGMAKSNESNTIAPKFVYDTNRGTIVNGIELGTISPAHANVATQDHHTFKQNVIGTPPQPQSQKTVTSSPQPVNTTIRKRVPPNGQHNNNTTENSRDSNGVAAAVAINPLGFNGSVLDKFRQSIDQIVDSDDEER